MVDNLCTSLDAEKYAKLQASKLMQITVVKVVIKSKVAPFYMRRDVLAVCSLCWFCLLVRIISCFFIIDCFY